MRRRAFSVLAARVPRSALPCSLYLDVSLARTPRPVHRKPVPLSLWLLLGAISSAVSRYFGGMQRYSVPTARRLHRTCVARRGVFMQNRPTTRHSTRARTRGCSALSKSDPHGSLLLSHMRHHKDLKHQPFSKLSRENDRLEMRIVRCNGRFYIRISLLRSVQEIENYRFYY